MIKVVDWQLIDDSKTHFVQKNEDIICFHNQIS